MHSKSDNRKIKINVKADEIIEKAFKSLLNRYQNNLEASMRQRMVSSLIVFIYCITNVINKSESWWIIYIFSRLDKKQKHNNKSHHKKR